MIKDAIQQNENITPNNKQLAVLREHFAACFKADGSFDIDRFKAELTYSTNIVQEGYELKFLGKSYAKLLASTETTTVIQPDVNHNSLPENAKSENIYISGDNLDGLKHLLKSYNGEIKCIYIDPPYNTGSDGFVYFDNFNYNKETLQEKLSVSEEEAEHILDLTKRGSASHSAWLMFMYSRLLLARDLLKDDGVIFISIDDNEQANLKLLCDDVFGEENFLTEMIWQKKTGSSDSKNIATITEYISLYCRDIKNVSLNQNYSAHDINRYRYQDQWIETRGPYYPDNLDRGTLGYIESLDYGISAPDGTLVFPNGRNSQFNDGWRWKWGKEKVEWGIKNGFIEVQESSSKEIGWAVYYKIYLNVDNEGEIIERSSPYKNLIQGVLNSEGSIEVNNIFGKVGVFSNPKPIKLLTKIIGLIQSKDCSFLDFFSGSASLANAVLQLNSEDNGRRKFIAVQLPEILNPENPSQKAAYEFLKENNLPITLDYIGIERIKRAAAKIKQEHPDKGLDLGFMHYILSEPNQNTLDKLESFDKAGLLADTSILDDFGRPTILATWLNADGYGFTANAENIELDGYTAYYCQKHLYLIDPGFTLEGMKALLSKYDVEGHFNPENLVLFGYSFPDWSINEMIEKNLRILNDGEKNLKINFTVRY